MRKLVAWVRCTFTTLEMSLMSWIKLYQLKDPATHSVQKNASNVLAKLPAWSRDQSLFLNLHSMNSSNLEAWLSRWLHHTWKANFRLQTPSILAHLVIISAIQILIILLLFPREFLVSKEGAAHKRVQALKFRAKRTTMEKPCFMEQEGSLLGKISFEWLSQARTAHLQTLKDSHNLKLAH